MGVDERAAPLAAGGSAGAAKPPDGDARRDTGAGPARRAASREWSLAVWIGGICLGVLAPMLIFSAVMIHRDVAERQAQGLESLQRSATRAAAAVGREVDEVLAELAVLSLTDSARRGDLRATHDLATRLVAMDSRLVSISLSTRTGRQALHTSRPFGAELPDSGTVLQQALFDGAERAVSPLIVAVTTRQPIVAVGRRVDLGPAGAYALRAAVRLDALTDSLMRQGWPPDWTAAMIDQNGTIIARSRDAQRFVGQPSTPGLLESARAGRSVFHASTKDGIATVATAAPVPGTGWYVVVGRPAAALEAQVWKSMTAVLLVGSLCGLFALTVAAVTARAIGAQLRRVVDAHVRGAAPEAGARNAIKEVREIGSALAASRAQASAAFAEVDAAREHALAQLRERSEMLDVLAHEVRQPLNNASAALQEANAAIASQDAPAIRAPLARANVVLGEVLASIDNTLAAAALLVGGKPTGRLDVDIDVLVTLVIGDMAKEQAHRVRVERTTGTRTASIEPNLLRLALRNLLSNALKFSPPDAPVTIRISDSDEPLAVIFDVIDQGDGIDSELLPRLFDRGDRRRRHLGGRRQGLGLTIARRVMQLHGGAVTLERTGPDGTTMRLTVVQSSEEA